MTYSTLSSPYLLALSIAWLASAESGCVGSPSTQPRHESLPVGSGRLAFSDVTAAAGLQDFKHITGAFGEKWFPETMGAGGGFIDYDGDGWLDILLVGGGSWPGRSEEQGVRALWLYRNNSDGTFVDMTEEMGLDGVRAYGFGITVADYDNDGDQDFFFTTLHENMLFRNDGTTFTEVGSEAGISDHAAWSTAAIFFDADRDGWLDLYVGNYVRWSPGEDIFCSVDGETKSYCTPLTYEGIPGRFYRNEGDGTFSEQTESAGFISAPGMTLGVAELDYNEDHWPDLVVANDTRRNLLYKNNGDGTFTELGTPGGIAFDENGKARAGMGVDAGEVDGSGNVSIFIGNFSDEMIGVYKHIGGGLFIDRAAASKIGRPSLPSLTFGLFLFDADLDGRLDLFAANGHVHEEIQNSQRRITYRQLPQLFMNIGDGTFEEVGQAIGGVFTTPLLARGAAYADYDHDGDLDLLITENGGPVHLWRNDLSDDATYLRVHLEGRASNRDGIGTRVTVIVGERRSSQWVRTGSSYLSQSAKQLTFGLGGATRVDSLLIYWPSGHVDCITGVEMKRNIRIVEGAEYLGTQPL